ncbi:DUF305 domain-containing protein [Sphaerisporangium aureirubrum]|uniref:DUF305 domain-containing protein n=1 Tax=Sphaerisporangium aureirubrum TaxID=1544736 RepID=A0ABW1NGX4_9ACTN
MRIRRVVTAVLIGVLVTGGCARPGPPPGPAPATGVPVPAAVTPRAGFGPTDIAWVELMIPMTEQALRLAALAEDRAADPAVRRLAGRIGAGQRADLVRLRRLLLMSGVPYTDPHRGHDMPGMATPGEFKVIEHAAGDVFGRLYTRNMRENLRQAALVARGEQASGTHPEVKSLATAVERSRTVQLAELERLTG